MSRSARLTPARPPATGRSSRWTPARRAAAAAGSRGTPRRAAPAAVPSTPAGPARTGPRRRYDVPAAPGPDGHQDIVVKTERCAHARDANASEIPSRPCACSTSSCPSTTPDAPRSPSSSSSRRRPGLTRHSTTWRARPPPAPSTPTTFVRCSRDEGPRRIDPLPAGSFGYPAHPHHERG